MLNFGKGLFNFFLLQPSPKEGNVLILWERLDVAKTILEIPDDIYIYSMSVKSWVNLSEFVHSSVRLSVCYSVANILRAQIIHSEPIWGNLSACLSVYPAAYFCFVNILQLRTIHKFFNIIQIRVDLGLFGCPSDSLAIVPSICLS